MAFSLTSTERMTENFATRDKIPAEASAKPFAARATAVNATLRGAKD
jgi:hypothetical protein